jgi:membrane dipeptidase
MGVEGGHMINSSLGVLRTLYELGGRYLTLTHSKHTPWAGSSGDTPGDDPGLTVFGREVVAEMNRLGMMVDVSHISDKTFWDVMGATSVPVIASHSSCRALSSHPRNMTDEMIQRVAEGGGVVHINYYNGFLSDEYRAKAGQAEHFDKELAAAREKAGANLQELAAAEWRINLRKVEEVGRVPFDVLLDHFEHAVRVGGVEHVGLGSDFDGVDEALPEGMEDISKLPQLAGGLRSRGLSGEDVEKILGANTVRVMRDVEAAAG